MNKAASESISIRHYFVDEAGDGTLFKGRGQVIIGTPGCSRFFLLGLLDVEKPEQLTRDLETLRGNLLADPYLNRIYSMQPKASKTAIVFHATDDAPEVRREAGCKS